MNIVKAVAAAIATAFIMISGPASAVIYGSAFDPPDFFGTATFDVSPGCLTSDGSHNNSNNGPPPGCSVTWLTAVVNFRETLPTPHIQTFDYSSVLPDPNAVFNIFVQAGELAGVNSGLIGPAFVSGDPNPSSNGPWWISFNFSSSSFSSFALDAGPAADGAFGLGTVSLFSGNCFEGCFPNQNPSETADVLRFFRINDVPEPGTLSLILAALACGRLRKGRQNAA